MDKETAHYIFVHYFHLSDNKTKLAWKHYSSSIKYKGATEVTLNFLKQNGWITENPEIFLLLNGGIDHFEMMVAEELFLKYPDKIILNKCPNCGKLTRTPQSKQCRFCYANWH